MGFVNGPDLTTAIQSFSYWRFSSGAWHCRYRR